MSQPYVRLAQPEEFDRILDLGRKAFINDPVLTYFSAVQDDVMRKENGGPNGTLRAYLSYLLHSCWLIGGRITVVVIPEDSRETIVGAAMWLPPHKRVKPWNLLTLLRAGIVSVTQNWGIEGVTRMAIEYSDVCYKSWKRGYKVEEERGSSEGSWYLQAILTSPDHQKKGMMSLLVKEAYSISPDSIFTLEATTEQARDHFTRLGFELLDRSKLGFGRVDRAGLPATGQLASGVEFYSMVNWNRENRHKS